MACAQLETVDLVLQVEANPSKRVDPSTKLVALGTAVWNKVTHGPHHQGAPSIDTKTSPGHTRLPETEFRECSAGSGEDRGRKLRLFGNERRRRARVSRPSPSPDLAHASGRKIAASPQMPLALPLNSPQEKNRRKRAIRGE